MRLFEADSLLEAIIAVKVDDCVNGIDAPGVGKHGDVVGSLNRGL